MLCQVLNTCPKGINVTQELDLMTLSSKTGLLMKKTKSVGKMTVKRVELPSF